MFFTLMSECIEQPVSTSTSLNGLWCDPLTEALDPLDDQLTGHDYHEAYGAYVSVSIPNYSF